MRAWTEREIIICFTTLLPASLSVTHSWEVIRWAILGPPPRLPFKKKKKILLIMLLSSTYHVSDVWCGMWSSALYFFPHLSLNMTRHKEKKWKEKLLREKMYWCVSSTAQNTTKIRFGKSVKPDVFVTLGQGLATRRMWLFSSSPA